MAEKQPKDIHMKKCLQNGEKQGKGRCTQLYEIKLPNGMTVKVVPPEEYRDFISGIGCGNGLSGGHRKP